MTEFSNLTDLEYFKLNGTLSSERIENLFDKLEILEIIADLESEKESLEEDINDLQALVKDLNETIKELNDKINQTSN